MVGKSPVIRLLAWIPCEISKTLRYIELKSAQVPSNGVWTNSLAIKMAIGHRVLWKKKKSSPESTRKAWISWRHHAAVTVLFDCIHDSSTVSCCLACRHWRIGCLKWQCHSSFEMLFALMNHHRCDVFAELNLWLYSFRMSSVGMSTHWTRRDTLGGHMA